MGKFEQIIKARQKLCEFNENPVDRATIPAPKNPVLDHISQDHNVQGAYQNYAQTGTVDPSIQQIIQGLGDQAKSTVDAAFQALQQKQAEAAAAQQTQQPPPQTQQAQQPPTAQPAQPAQPTQPVRPIPLAPNTSQKKV